jgi:hypothetical protein
MAGDRTEMLEVGDFAIIRPFQKTGWRIINHEPDTSSSLEDVL